MLFNDPVCFPRDRVPVRPIQLQGRPYQAVDVDVNQINIGPTAPALACQLAEQAGRPRGRRLGQCDAPPDAMVEFDLAARRPTMPVRVRAPHPCRAPWRPYGLGRRRMRSGDGAKAARKASLWTEELAAEQVLRLWFDQCKTCPQGLPLLNLILHRERGPKAAPGRIRTEKGLRMRTHTRRLKPPTDANELLAALRAGRLISPQQFRKLTIGWSESRPDEPDDIVEGTRRRALELVESGCLTSWQVEQVLSGRARRLRLGPYRLLEWLGAGGMGSVYKAEHRLMKRLVALKMLGDSPRRNAVELCPNQMQERAARSRREVEAAAGLSHPNIVAAYDAIYARGKLILVMEYVEGVDLGRLVALAGPLPVALACEAVRQCALALHYAHDHGILHCDVKPSNLLLLHPPVASWEPNRLAALAEDRRSTRIKLLDMGLARKIDDGDGWSEGELEGTPDYLAPERGSGETVDGRADVYSLGCTFYHLLTGQPPFPGGDWAGKLLRHRLDSPPPVQALRPDLPPEIAAIVARMTARDPARRYASAGEAAVALQGCLATAPLAVQDANRKPSRKRLSRVLLPAILLTGATLSGAAWCALAPAQRRTAALPSTTFHPFIVDGRLGGFASLTEAVAAADNGAVITIRGVGPYLTPPLVLHGRSLTLRAAPDCRPCLEIRASLSDPWLTLLTTDRDLNLQGLDLRLRPDPSGRDAGGRLICCEAGSLSLSDCRLFAPGGAGLVFRNGGKLSLDGCRVETDGTAVSMEVGEKQTCQIRIVNTTLEARAPASAGLALWSTAIGQPTTVEVQLTNDTLHASRDIALTALAAGLRVTARGNNFIFGEGLLSCAGYADVSTWRRGAVWQGSDNSYRGAGPWLHFDVDANDIIGADAWRALWDGGELGARAYSDAQPFLTAGSSARLSNK